MWRVSLFAIFWSLWKERNGRVFRGSSLSVEEIKDLVFFCIAKWASRNGKFDNLKLKDILRNREASIHYTTPEIFSGGRDFEVQR